VPAYYLVPVAGNFLNRKKMSAATTYRWPSAHIMRFLSRTIV